MRTCSNRRRGRFCTDSNALDFPFFCSFSFFFLSRALEAASRSLRSKPARHHEGHRRKEGVIVVSREGRSCSASSRPHSCRYSSWSVFAQIAVIPNLVYGGVARIWILSFRTERNDTKRDGNLGAQLLVSQAKAHSIILIYSGQTNDDQGGSGDFLILMRMRIRHL
jgi:hypothetical protein